MGHGRGLQSWSGFLPAPSPSWQILNTLYNVNRTLKIAAPLGRAVSQPDSSRARRVPAAHPEPRAASLLLPPQSFRWSPVPVAPRWQVHRKAEQGPPWGAVVQGGPA